MDSVAALPLRQRGHRGCRLRRRRSRPAGTRSPASAGRAAATIGTSRARSGSTWPRSQTGDEVVEGVLERLAFAVGITAQAKPASSGHHCDLERGRPALHRRQCATSDSRRNASHRHRGQAGPLPPAGSSRRGDALCPGDRRLSGRWDGGRHSPLNEQGVSMSEQGGASSIQTGSRRIL